MIRKIAVFCLLLLFAGCLKTPRGEGNVNQKEEILNNQKLLDKAGLILFEMQLKGSPEFFERAKIEEIPSEPEVLELTFEWFDPKLKALEKKFFNLWCLGL